MYTISLNIAGNKIDFEMAVRHTYDNNCRFDIQDNQGALVYSGSIYKGRYATDYVSNKLEYFYKVIENAAKPILKNENYKFSN